MEEKDPAAYKKWKEAKAVNLVENTDRNELTNDGEVITEKEPLAMTDDTLLNGEVRRKNDAAFECLGLIEELNANVGYVS